MKITIKQTLGRDIHFEGYIIMSNRCQTGNGLYTLMEVYSTSLNNFACSKVYETDWEGCTNKYLAKICKNHEEIIKFFGLGDQAKELYSQIEIEASITEEQYFKEGNLLQEDQDLNEFDDL